MIRISRQSSKRMARLRAGVSAIALVIGAGLLLAPGSASAGGIFNDTLCGGTVSTDVTAKNDTDNVAGSCIITILDGASLTVKDYTLSVGIRLQINGQGDAAFTMKRTDLTTTGDFELNFASGDVAIVDENHLSIGDTVSIRTTSGGDIVFKDNPNTVTMGNSTGNGNLHLTALGAGSITLKNTYFIPDDEVSVETQDGDIEVLDGTVIDMTRTNGDITFAVSGSGSLTVRDSRFEYDLTGGNGDMVDSALFATNTGNITFRDNTVLFFDSDNSGGLEIDSNGGGMVTVRDNINSHVSDSVDVDSNAGNLTVRGNEFTNSTPADNDANSTGNCTVTNNSPGFTGSGNCPTGPG